MDFALLIPTRRGPAYSTSCRSPGINHAFARTGITLGEMILSPCDPATHSSFRASVDTSPLLIHILTDPSPIFLLTRLKWCTQLPSPSRKAGPGVRCLFLHILAGLMGKTESCVFFFFCIFLHLGDR